MNDAGNQINLLAESINARYLQLCGLDAEIPEDGYHGQDIIDTAKNILAKDGKKYLDMDEKERLEIFKELGLQEKLADLKKDLFMLRMQHATNQLDNPLRIAAVKKDIARIKTIIRENETK